MSVLRNRKKYVHVILTGMFGRVTVARNIQAYLQDHGYSCFLLSLPYHDVPLTHKLTSDSERWEQLSHLTLEDDVQYVQEFIKKNIGTETSFALSGWSMGGLRAAINAQYLVENMVAMSLFAPAPPEGISPLFGGPFGIYPSVLTSFLPNFAHPLSFWREPGKMHFWQARYSMMHRLPREEQRRIYEEEMVWESGRAASELLGIPPFNKRHTTRVDAEKFKCASLPILVFQGSEDRIVKPAVSEKVAMYYGAEYRLLLGHAHWLPAEPGWRYIMKSYVDWLEVVAKTR